MAPPGRCVEFQTVPAGVGIGTDTSTSPVFWSGAELKTAPPRGRVADVPLTPALNTVLLVEAAKAMPNAPLMSHFPGGTTMEQTSDGLGLLKETPVPSAEIVPD